MKKRTEIQQDLKRGFGFAPTGIKNLVKWLSVGFMVYVAVRFVCAFVGGVVVGLGGEKICKAFGEKFSTARLDGLKNFRQNPQGAKRPCIFSPRPYLPPETSKVKPPTRHK